MSNKKKIEAVESSKKFIINVESMINGKKETFTFSAPENAPLGLVYDVTYRLMVEVTKIIEKKNESLKRPSNDDKTDKHIEPDSSSL